MTFAVIQFVPGGPVEQVIAKMQGTDTDSTGRISGNTGNEAGGSTQQPGAAGDVTAFKYRGAQGLDPEFIKESREAVRLRQAGPRALPADDGQLSHLRFRRELFPRPHRGRA